jgi:hypothetical protein
MKAYKYIMMYRENQNQKNEDVSSSDSSASCSASASASSSSACALYASYIDTIEFRLRFIRCELFNIKLSVQRFFCYLNFIHDTWGNDILLKNSLITVKDLTKVESKLLSMGLLQVLPYRDRSGRRVITITGHGIVHDVDPVVLVRFYFILSCFVLFRFVFPLYASSLLSFSLALTDLTTTKAFSHRCLLSLSVCLSQPMYL